MNRPPRPIRQPFALAVLLVAALAGLAWGQGMPRVALVAAEDLRPGNAVVIEADGLTPDAAYLVRLEGPDGVVVEEPLPQTNGAGRLTLDLLVAGRHTISLAGPDLEARFFLRVEDAPPVAVDPEPTPAVPEPAAPEPAGPEPTEAPTEPERAPAPTEAPPAAPAQPEPTPQPAPAPERAPDPTPVPPATTSAVVLVVEDGVVVARDGLGEPRWRLAFPAGAGDVTTALTHLGRGWLAVGHQVLEVDLERGAILARVATSGTIVDLQPVGTGLNVRSEVATAGRPRSVEARLEGGVLTPAAVFDPTSDLFGALRREAASVDADARAAVDPTNPYLHLAAARAAAAAGDDAGAAAAVDAALASATTFYDLARLARDLAADGRLEDADRAMANLLCGLLHPGFVDVPQHHLRAIRGQPRGDRAPDALRGP
ncbi:MAG: hypothetical protein P1P87_12075, partial [Trueperaceae bacterium]|nr:hypothetical protein [Trueperaceae bacterium]